MKYLRYISNRYALTTIIFLVWMAFLDANNLFSQRRLRVNLYEKADQKERLKIQIEKINIDMHDLTTNPKSLEKFAREKYLMKKENEIIFVIMEKEKEEILSLTRASLSPL